MNVYYLHTSTPLRVLMVNPLSETGRMLSLKIFRGVCFGHYQLVNLIFLVYSNEIEQAEQLKCTFSCCALPCFYGITIRSDVPSLSDADVFIFITDFPSLNSMDFSKIDEDAIFDSLYLLLKIAPNLEMLPAPTKAEDDPFRNIRKYTKIEKTRRPIIFTDGLIALDILKNFSKNLPRDMFFCGSPLTCVSKTVLADKLGVSCEAINELYVWAVNDKVFHVDVDPPIFKGQKLTEKSTDRCICDITEQTYFDDLGTDTQFNTAWMKKDFLQKLCTMMENQQIGSIYTSVMMAHMIRRIWSPRSMDPTKVQANVGIISDGSLETHKGLPYVLPVFLEGDSYKISTSFEDDFHLKQEIKRMNKVVKAHHEKLIPYCKKFLEKNVINMEFLHKNTDSTSQDFTSSSEESPVHDTTASSLHLKW